MTHKIVFSGTAYGISYEELDDAEFESLLREIEVADDIVDVERVSDLISGSYSEYGMLTPENEYLELTVDGEDRSDLIDAFLERHIGSASNFNVSSNMNLLVLEAAEDIEFTCEAKEFDPKDLDASMYRITLPDGEKKVIFHPSLPTSEFDYGDAEVIYSIRIFNNDGEELDY